MTDSAKSINEVQEAEEHAGKLVADAKQEGEQLIREAKERAAKMVSSAGEEYNTMGGFLPDAYQGSGRGCGKGKGYS